MENNWKAYCTFSRKERTGIVVLILLIVSVTVLPCFYTDRNNTATGPADPELMALIERMRDTANRQSAYAGQQRNSYQYQRRYHEDPEPATAVLTDFDPNTLPVEGWRKLGVREQTIQTIQRYIAKGGQFRKPEDIGRIYGLSPEKAQQLMPYVKIPAGMQWPNGQTYAKPAASYSNKKNVPDVIEINEADTSAFIALPGIGSKLAERIVKFRDKLGGFYAVEQVAETWGLPDSVFQRIKTQLQCVGGVVRTININTADAATLKQHPYMNWSLANAIVKYRQQHGLFTSPEGLQQIEILAPDVFKKILPYLATE